MKKNFKKSIFLKKNSSIIDIFFKTIGKKELHNYAKKFTYLSCSIINININIHENNLCPRGEISRHKGLRIL